MVAGFYNASLTRSLAIQAFPALYVDLDADLTISTEQALDWLLGHGLLVRGSLVGYDDWHETPFLRGGESLAHLRITRRFEVEWEHLPTSDLLREEELLGEEDAARSADRPGCRQGVMFRVASIGVRSDPGISPALVRRSCRMPPLNAPLRVPSETCVQHAQRELAEFDTGVASVGSEL